MTLFVLKCLGAFFLLGVSATLSLAETAFMSLSRLQLSRLSRARPARLDFWQRDPDRALSVLLLMNNVVNAGLGVLSVSLALDAASVFSFPFQWGGALFPLGMGALLILFGEVGPKSLARAHPEPLALFLAPSVRFLTVVFGPLMRGVLEDAERLLAWLLRRVRTERAQWDPSVIRGLLEAAPLGYPLRRMLTNVVSFAQTPVAAVMTPRAEIMAVNLSSGRTQAIHRIVASGYSRVPVHRGSLDTVEGMVYSKDLLAPWRSEALIVLADLIRPIPRVRPDAPLAAVLRDFRQGHHHMALVAGADGKVLGLVTLQDALEAIVGDIAREPRP